MTGFIKRKVKSLTLGEKLKKIRKKSGISLAEIATHTKVKKDYLKKIEAGNFEKLPFDVYVKGFLRSYAKYLGLDSEKVITQFKKEVGVRENVEKYQKNKNRGIDFKMPNLTITPKKVSIFFSGLAILVGFFYFYLEVDHFSQKPTLIIETPVSDETIKNSSVKIAGFTDLENKLTINNEPVFIDSEGNFSETVGLQNGFNEITVEVFNKFDKSTKKILNILANYEIEILGTTTEKDDLLHEEFIVEIESREIATLISIKVDDREKTESTLQPGSSLRVKVKNEIEISSGKANNTYVKINEGDFFILAENNENFEKISLNKEGIIADKDEGGSNKN